MHDWELRFTYPAYFKLERYKSYVCKKCGKGFNHYYFANISFNEAAKKSVGDECDA